MILEALVLGSAVSLAAGRWLCRGDDFSNRLLGTVVAGGFAVVAGLFATTWLAAPYSPWDVVRLAAPMAALRGFPLYASEHSGAVLSTMYGPIGMMAFAPAACLNDPAWAAVAGRWLATLFSATPLLVAIQIDGYKSSRTWRATVALAALATLLAAPALRYSGLYLHADAPALGLLGLACLLIVRPGPTSRLLAGVVVVLAVASKQTMIGLPLALTLAVVLGQGWRSAGIWCSILGLATILIVGSLGFCYSGQDLRLNLLSIPGGVPWRGQMPGNVAGCAAELLLHALPLVGLGLVLGGRISWGSWRERLRRDQPLGVVEVLILVALTMAPLAILGRVKQAGDINSFSPCLYPLLLAMFSASAAIEPTARRKHCLAVVLILVGVVGVLRLEAELKTLATLRPGDTETRFLRDHPGLVYLPWHPAAHLSIEGRPTHHLFTAWERGVAGFPVSRTHLESAMPRNYRYVAFPLKRLGPVAGFGSCFRMLEERGFRVDIDHPTRLAGLADYECFRVTR